MPPSSTLAGDLHPQLQALVAKIPARRLLGVLRSLAHSASPEAAILLYNHLLRRASPHDLPSSCYTFALKACSALLPRRGAPASAKAREVHARAIGSGRGSDLFVGNALITLYAAAGDVGSARRAFASISDPDVVSWTAMVSGLARNGREAEAVAAFSCADVEPNAVMLVAVLSACARLGALGMGKAVHGYGLKTFGHACNAILDNSVLDMYMRCGAPDSARNLFERLRVRDVVSWTAMISGYVRQGRNDAALAMFEEMLRRGEAEPNEATVVSVLAACAAAGALSMGKCVHSSMSEIGVAVVGPAGNALINLYAKCGDMSRALAVFDEMPGKDSVTWGTVLGGMALNGSAKHAVELFSLMIRHGVRPDGVAFLAVLSACCHAGLVDQGLLFFHAMYRIYGVVPDRQHYACVVDMFGRAGMLEEAETFAEAMPVDPDVCTLSTLLSARRIHGPGVKTGLPPRVRSMDEVVAGGGTYALLSNIYSGAGDWSHSGGTREAMRLRGVKKAAGCSWVELAEGNTATGALPCL